MSVCKESSAYNSDDDSDFTDNMSRLTMDDDDDDNIDEDEDMGTMLSNTSDFESRTSKNVTARKSRRSSGKGTDAWCGTTSIGLPYVIDFWKNKTPQNTIGIQVWMM